MEATMCSVSFMASLDMGWAPSSDLTRGTTLCSCWMFTLVEARIPFFVNAAAARDTSPPLAQPWTPAIQRRE
ncbi:uncharacterized protein CC84DRAFT_180582 [Paraphaeosphaeria sporulosa]|uniref:Uncharacterized protein n=1 Tax=Paraphaeosphaeria sporulosa TaxID=1460663 RepID=A0A177D088_9PLEO|nr:uncharacterized protein CC84DRAFT_180582 [Paraphaeosphaeria sporulosa]OAG13123.1 hypothetical protein CC84DRAFT_180582 [Paraphaeosphaeria sporulosa]